MLTTEDHIVLIRLLFGSIYGFVAYLIYRLRVSIPFVKTDLLIWILAALVYVITAYYVKRTTGSSSLLHLYIRGFATFYGSWLIIFLVMYDLLH